MKIIVCCIPTSNNQQQISDTRGKTEILSICSSQLGHNLFWMGVFCGYKMAATLDEFLHLILNQRLSAGLHFSPEDFLPGWSVLLIKFCLSIGSQHHILSLHFIWECAVGQVSLMLFPACHSPHKSFYASRVSINNKNQGSFFIELSAKGQLGTSPIICQKNATHFRSLCGLIFFFHCYGGLIICEVVKMINSNHKHQTWDFLKGSTLKMTW